MKKLLIAIPCVISGLVMGAMTLTQAGPNQPQIQTQGRRINLITVTNTTDATSPTAVYGCFAGAEVTDCIVDAISSFDADNTFKLQSATGTIHCGANPMVHGATCTYAAAYFGVDCDDDRCDSATISANQSVP